MTIIRISKQWYECLDNDWDIIEEFNTVDELWERCWEWVVDCLYQATSLKFECSNQKTCKKLWEVFRYKP